VHKVAFFCILVLNAAEIHFRLSFCSQIYITSIIDPLVSSGAISLFVCPRIEMTAPTWPVAILNVTDVLYPVFHLKPPLYFVIELDGHCGHLHWQINLFEELLQ
jgi:hypothetical protein